MARRRSGNDRPADEFLAMLAHEFRNPLAPIRSAVEIMRVIGQQDHALEKAREVISRQVDQLSRLVDQLLDVSDMTKGTMALSKEAVDVNAILWRAVDRIQPFVDERGHRLTVAPLSVPVSIEADPERLCQVLVNLLENAARYTDPGGEIALTATRDDDAVVVTVRDNGRGIAAERLPDLFDLFTGAPRAVDQPRGSLGVGLSLVRSIVELHGGTVEARSEGAGHGAEFVVTLPLAERQAQAGGIVDSHAGRETPRRIVVIDDNVDAAESLAMLLRLTGHEVHIAFDGPSGVELVRRTAPDCVLVDIGLPGIDGYEVAKRLRAHDDGDMLLVAVTGYGQPADRIKSGQAGFDHHVVKPVSQSVLERLLREG